MSVVLLNESDVLRACMALTNIGRARLAKVSGHSEQEIEMMTLGVLTVSVQVWETLDAGTGTVESIRNSAVCERQRSLQADES